jgi:CheY-like chemotaxis protein
VKKLNWKLLTILVAEDDEELRSIICTLLEMEGAKVYSACDGNEAFEILKSVKIDIIISDIQMPQCSGIELMDKVKRQLKPPPVIFLATGHPGVSEADAKEKGALSLIQKPFNFEKLKEILCQTLMNHKDFKAKFG